MKFKIGDKVKILSLATGVGVESEDVGKAGVITNIGSWDIMVKMDEVCKIRGHKCDWSVGAHMIELSPRKNEQLLFSFMEG